MKNQTVKILAGTGLGVILGWWVLPYFLKRGGAAYRPPTTQVRDAPPINRVAGDMVNACQQLTPFFRQLEISSRDGLSVQDMVQLYYQIQRIST